MYCPRKKSNLQSKEITKKTKQAEAPKIPQVRKNDGAETASHCVCVCVCFDIVVVLPACAAVVCQRHDSQPREPQRTFNQQSQSMEDDGEKKDEK